MKVLKFLTNVQIVSALIWAVVILCNGYFNGSTEFFNVLIFCAGIHVLYLYRLAEKQECAIEAKE